MTDFLYADGGVISRNPSAIGGTWAWVRVEDDRDTAHESGVLLSATTGTETVSNNNTELWALLQGIAALPDGWEGTVASDSMIALGWIFHGFKVNNIPQPLREKLCAVLQDAERRGLKMTPKMLAGHPKPADIKAGIRLSKAPHLPVSSWNVFCDDLCGKRGRLYLLSLKG